MMVWRNPRHLSVEKGSLSREAAGARKSTASSVAQSGTAAARAVARFSEEWLHS